MNQKKIDELKKLKAYPLNAEEWSDEPGVRECINLINEIIDALQAEEEPMGSSDNLDNWTEEIDPNTLLPSSNDGRLIGTTYKGTPTTEQVRKDNEERKEYLPVHKKCGYPFVYHTALGSMCPLPNRNFTDVYNQESINKAVGSFIDPLPERMKIEYLRGYNQAIEDAIDYLYSWHLEHKFVLTEDFRTKLKQLKKKQQ